MPCCCSYERQQHSTGGVGVVCAPTLSFVLYIFSWICLGIALVGGGIGMIVAFSLYGNRLVTAHPAATYLVLWIFVFVTTNILWCAMTMKDKYTRPICMWLAMAIFVVVQLLNGITGLVVLLTVEVNVLLIAATVLSFGTTLFMLKITASDWRNIMHTYCCWPKRRYCGRECVGCVV